jgi:hypothetical protein
VVTATLKVNNKTTSGEEILAYKGKGKDAFEALSNIPIEWHEVKYKGEIELVDGKKKASKFLQLPQLRRLIISKARRKGWAFLFQRMLKDSKKDMSFFKRMIP